MNEKLYKKDRIHYNDLISDCEIVILAMAAIDNKAFYRRLYTLAMPIVIQSLMLALVAAGDALMLGQVAQEEMTAVSLATQIQFVQNMFLGAITMAGGILGAQYFGKGDRCTIEELFNLMLRYCGLLSVLFFAGCEFFPEQLMHIFTHDRACWKSGGIICESPAGAIS